MSWPRKKPIKNIIEEQNSNTDIDNMLNAIASNTDAYLTAEQKASYKEELVFA